MPKANSAGSIVGMRRRGRFCASCRTWRDICGRKFLSTSWNEKPMLKAIHRPPRTCKRPSANCSREYFAGGPLERKWGRGPTARSGLRPGPCGGCAPATCSKSKTFLGDENIRRNGSANFRRLRCDCPIENSNQKGGPTAELRSSSRLIVRL